jgi:hypothetical protein
LLHRCRAAEKTLSATTQESYPSVNSTYPLAFPGRFDSFPHCRRYFHKKIGVTNRDLPADIEYLTNQRRRNLPVGESGQGPSGEPATGLAKHSGNWLPRNGTRESSYGGCDDGRVWESAGFARSYQTILKWQSVVIWRRTGSSKNRKAGGEISKEKSPLRFYESERPKGRFYRQGTTKSTLKADTLRNVCGNT